MPLNLDEIRDDLLAKREELTARQARVAKHTRHRESPLSQDFAEQAVELENGETLVALDQEIADEIARINRAVLRIDDGTYASCEECGEAISEARLKALPYSTLCIDCASEKR
jgi:RNA polymerase-binding protein DksA